MPILSLWTRRTDPFSAATFSGQTEIVCCITWHPMDAQEQLPTAIRCQLLCGCSWLTEVALQAHQRSVLSIRLWGPPSLVAAWIEWELWENGGVSYVLPVKCMRGKSYFLLKQAMAQQVLTDRKGLCLRCFCTILISQLTCQKLYPQL